MSLPLVYRWEARDEIDEAYAWYEQQRSGLGEEFLTTLRESLDRIQQNPDMYGVIHRKVRGSPMQRFPYVVYYRVDSDRISVIAVQHSKRHPRRWRSRA